MKTIGVVGGGQLCLMLGESILQHKLPYKLVSLDPTPHSPASRVVEKQIVGTYDDEEKVKELAEKSDVVTFEIELAGSKALSEVDKPVFPEPKILTILQDKFTQADFLQNSNIAVPKTRAISSKEDLVQATKDLGLPLMVKARKDSYDGKGNAIIRQEEDIDDVLVQFATAPIMAQQFINFDKELSVMCAKSIHGEIVTFPTAENVHGKEYNILHSTIVPAQISSELDKKAQALAKACVEQLDTVGMFGIEMLVIGDDVLINEIAPRVHNSGHYSIEACDTSQFSLQLQAVAGEQLSQPTLTAPSVVMYNLIGFETGPYQLMYEDKHITHTKEVESGVFVHDYGKKESRAQRKLGHITILGRDNETIAQLLTRAKTVFNHIVIKT